MGDKLKPLLLALSLGLGVVAIGIGFLFGLDNPFSWIMIVLLIAVVIFLNVRSKRPFVEWDEIYHTGIDSIDDQHRQLVELLNQFQSAYEYHTSDEFERQCLEELVEYTQRHFGYEEGLLEEHDYPELSGHKEQHQLMIAKVNDFLAAYQSNGHEALGEVAIYLREWLIKHISGTDKEYSGYLIQRGVK